MNEKKLHPFDIDEMIAREDDPKARAYLIILSSLHHALVANTSATLEIKRSLDEHLNNFEKQTEEHRALMNQGRGAWRVLAWVFAAGQAVGAAVWIDARSEIKEIRNEIQLSQRVEAALGARITAIEAVTRTNRP